jgi:Cu2+-exporting ATPase
LVKGGDVLETLATPGLMLLDKTGTLTRGHASVQQWTGDSEALVLAASLEQHSVHPVARAIISHAGSAALLSAARARHTVGGGLDGEIAGHRVVVGSPEFVLSSVNTRSIPGVVDVAMAGLTPVVVAIDGVVRGIFGIGDSLRDDALQSVKQLRADGWRIGILSGDHEAVVARVAQQLSLDPLDCRGGLSPEDKATFVREAIASSTNGPVVMVGDGVNDAAALSTASVGIAVHGGAEASLAAADVYLSHPGLAPVTELVAAGGRSLRGVKATLWASLFYNLSAAGLAVAGIIDPIMAAIFMPFSSMTVLTIAFVWRTFPRPEAAPSSTGARP